MSCHPANHSFKIVFHLSVIAWTATELPVRACCVMNRKEKGGCKAAEVTKDITCYLTNILSEDSNRHCAAAGRPNCWSAKVKRIILMRLQHIKNKL